MNCKRNCVSSIFCTLCCSTLKQEAVRNCGCDEHSRSPLPLRTPCETSWPDGTGMCCPGWLPSRKIGGGDSTTQCSCLEGTSRSNEGENWPFCARDPSQENLTRQRSRIAGKRQRKTLLHNQETAEGNVMRGVLRPPCASLHRSRWTILWEQTWCWHVYYNDN